jgi:transcriptional regulator with XRE-family HTH domain
VLTTKAQDKKHQEFLDKLGARIVLLRKRKKMSQNDLALECGWDKPNLRRLEKGRVNPSLKTLLILCEGLGVTVQELLDF